MVSCLSGRRRDRTGSRLFRSVDIESNVGGFVDRIDRADLVAVVGMRHVVDRTLVDVFGTSVFEVADGDRLESRVGEQGKDIGYGRVHGITSFIQPLHGRISVNIG